MIYLGVTVQTDFHPSAKKERTVGFRVIRAGVGQPLLITPFSIGLARSKERLLTGDTIDAHEAARLGMVSRVVPHDDLMSECEKVAKKICLLSPIGVKMTKASVNRALERMGLLSAINDNLESMIHFDISTDPEQDEFNTISHEQGLKAALNWRDARFKDL